jgi:hypothetical protein
MMATQLFLEMELSNSGSYVHEFHAGDNLHHYSVNILPIAE